MNTILKNNFTRSIYRFLKNPKGYNWYKKQYHLFKKSELNTQKRFSLEAKDNFLCLNDNTSNTVFDRHYVYHLAWAARVVKQINPAEHVDISSSLHFPTILSAFIKVKYFDYRPAQLVLNNLTSDRGDLNKLPFTDNSIESISCMHTIEHIGLGRYGDPIDYDGDLKAIKELKRVVAINGSLLFVVPIGKPRIQYNAHRIYSYQQVLSYFENFELKEFALVTDNPDDGDFIRNASQQKSDEQEYGCGCFWFVKKK